MLGIILLLLVVFWVGFLVSWAAQPSTSASGTAAALRLALLHHGNANDPFWQVWLDGFHHASHTFNIPTQITSFHDRLDDAPTLLLGVCTSVDGVVVTVPFRKSSVLYEQMDGAINSCIDRGAVILIANTDTYENKRAVAYVGSNNYEIGWECARYFVSYMAHDFVRAELTKTWNGTVRISGHNSFEDFNAGLDMRTYAFIKYVSGYGVEVVGDNESADLEMSTSLGAQTNGSMFVCGDVLASLTISAHGQDAYAQGEAALTRLALRITKQSLAIVGNYNSQERSQASIAPTYSESDCIRASRMRRFSKYAYIHEMCRAQCPQRGFDGKCMEYNRQGG